jgi:putative ATP-dependent endonuclease of OLD family
MPSVHSISINNFRGIEHLEQTFDANNLIVLIGRCDSGKSTVLKAISLALCPYWNPNISSADFYKEDVTKPIEISVTVKDVPDELLSEKKFGLHFRLLKDGQIVDDVQEGEPDSHVLTIKFVVEGDLEPKWYVTNGRNGIEDVEIKHSDRAKFKAFYISDYIDSQFTLSKGSPLYSLLTKSLPDGVSVGKKLLEVTRDANDKVAEKNNFAEFDQSLSEIKNTASSLGLNLGDLKALLELKENVYSQSSITLHEGDIPFHLRGKGAKRLLSIAIQLSLVEDGGIILIDEIEQGLEPDRVVNIVKLLKGSPKGQVFITTHSSEALCEVEYNNVYILQSGVPQMGACDDSLKSVLRKAPYTFFAKRIICCEGKTEYGIIRSIGDHIRETKNISLGALGVCPADCGGGTNHLDWALKFKSLGYDVCVFCDNDQNSRSYINKVSQVNQADIPIFTWQEGFCTEQQMMQDLTWDNVIRLIKYLFDYKNWKSINVPEVKLTEEVDLNNLSEAHRDSVREYIAKESKSNDPDGKQKRWFKDIPGGEILGTLWVQSIPDIGPTATLSIVYENLTNWISPDVEVD